MSRYQVAANWYELRGCALLVFLNASPLFWDCRRDPGFLEIALLLRPGLLSTRFTPTISTEPAGNMRLLIGVPAKVQDSRGKEGQLESALS
ncbi:MAG: hypothetical protein DMG54_10025 [Acidobacteria bacterium]|nr:MAG: hypothetical protein DMG54_10025 [Acidobacteriota bacterium]